MRKNKSIILLLVLAMMITTFGGAFAEDNPVVTSEKPTDNDKVNDLIEAGLVVGDGIGYNLDDSITRAEVVTMLVRLQGKEDIANTMKSMSGSFTDVSTEHWANGNINYAAAMGITKGFPDKTFKPQAAITNTEVVALLVRAAGVMTKEEEENAVWPGTYLIKGSQAGIIKDVNITDYSGAATREKTFEMVFNVKSSIDAEPEVVTVGNAVEALVIDNERIGRIDAGEVEVMVVKDQYIKDEGLVAGDTFEIKLSDVYSKEELDSENILGKVLKVYFDEKGKPAKISIDDSYDYVDGLLTDIKMNEVEINDRAYSLTVDANGREDRVLGLSIYNNKKVGYNEANGFRVSVNKDEFVRATVKNGNVLAIEAFDFKDIAPVSKVDEKDIYYIDNYRSGLERKLVATDKDTVVLKYSKGFSSAKLSDIKENDIIHLFTDRSNKTVVVVMDSNEVKIGGTFKGVSFLNRNDRKPTIEIEDEKITTLVSNGSFSPVYSTLADVDKYYVLTTNYLSELEGFYNEEAVAYVDIFGNLQKLVGNEKAETRFVAVITDTFYKELELALGTGAVNFYDVTRNTKFYKTSGSSIITATSNEFDKYDLVRVLADGSDIVEIVKLTDSESVISNMNKNVIDFNGSYYYIDGSTTVFALDMANIDKSKVMTVDKFLNESDTTKTMKGYVVEDVRDGNIAEHIIITEYTKKRTTNIAKSTLEIRGIRAEGANYVVTLRDQNGDDQAYLVEGVSEIAKLKSNSLVVGDIVELIIEKDTGKFLEMNLVLRDNSPVFYVESIGRGGARNLNFVVLEDTNDSTKTIWVSATAKIFGSYDEGSKVIIGEVDAYNNISVIKVVASNRSVTGLWATADELAVEGFIARLRALPELASFTLENKAEVVAIRGLYTDMTTEAKAMVTVGDIGTLEAYEAKIVVLEQKATDRAVINAFISALNLIPETVTRETISLVTDARAAYDILTPAQAGMVVMADYNTLVDAEAEVVAINDDLAAVQLFVDGLDALPEIESLTLGDAAALTAVRTTFDNLTPNQLIYVDQADIDLLESYETKMATL